MEYQFLTLKQLLRPGQLIVIEPKQKKIKADSAEIGTTPTVANTEIEAATATETAASMSVRIEAKQ